MCTVSMIMDHYREQWQPRLDQVIPYQGTTTIMLQPAITPEEIAEFRKLLERAREYDRKNNEPDCELDEKKQALLAIAAKLGVEISFL